MWQESFLWLSSLPGGPHPDAVQFPAGRPFAEFHFQSTVAMYQALHFLCPPGQSFYAMYVAKIFGHFEVEDLAEKMVIGSQKVAQGVHHQPLSQAHTNLRSSTL